MQFCNSTSPLFTRTKGVITAARLGWQQGGVERLEPPSPPLPHDDTEGNSRSPGADALQL